MRARFYTAVGVGGTAPVTRRREILFCGRSNVGKSSLLNALTGVRGLARTSKTPGRTREIHFYEDGPDRFLVDLPGYGYAKVSREDRRAWGQVIDAYLASSDRITLAILLVDSRHPPFEMDLGLAGGLESRGIPYVVALTKGDKVGQGARSAALGRAREAFPAALEVLVTSAKTGAGLRELGRRVEVATNPVAPREQVR